MINIPLQAIPNQSLSIQLDGINFDLRIKTCDNTPQTLGSSNTTITITANEAIIVQNVRMVPLTALINYQYLEQGNFFLYTENDDYPDYTLFGVSQYLIYATQQELEDLRNGTSS